ncbi:hypothetical protein DPMN_164906 [Dreissena polymorpha]|uniref:Uncharacterized protein n=1 Tax=Dreissena polymorpha TaxID=45954 RepID=A0A9D4EZC7_DREPO|nr:hypothetical protein DPMN_164906 [Dreissena polymorpha]
MFLKHDIIGTHCLTKFYEDPTIIVASSRISLETNVLTKFHEVWTINNASRLFTRQMLTLHNNTHHTTDKRRSQKLNISTLCSENCPPPSSHETNVLRKFHENWAKNVTSTVFTYFHYIHIEKNAPPTGGYVFSLNPTIFKLIRDINKTDVLTNFHDDWAKIVTSRMFTRENCPPTGGHVFQRIKTTFELN